MLRVTPPGEDGAPGRRSGNSSGASTPAGEDGISRPYPEDEVENLAQHDAEIDDDDDLMDEDDDYFKRPSDPEFLQMVREASAQAEFYSNQVNRRAWERAYMAYRQQHFTGSKYGSADFKNRSRLFIPKTRASVRKDLASVSASLFGNTDAIAISPGNEGDPQQRGSAAVLQELVNYRTDRTNGKSAMPWFLTAMGARQTSLLTGFCVSKQSWKLELRRNGTETVPDEETGEHVERDIWVPAIDRPDCQLIAPENCTIDPACDWTNPAQDSAYFIIRWPMRIDEIRRRQNDPRRPWKKVADLTLRSSGTDGERLEASAIRRARDQGLDRFDEAQTGPNFDVVWVWETFIRTAGEDWTFISLGDKELLTDPAPVIEVYPEQEGERPITFGYGSFEAFCVFPMAAVESWQMLQQEANDVRNLTLDAFKQNVMPVTKVVRGRQIDLDQLKRRAWGASIMVNKPDDVTWERTPDIPQSAQLIRQQIDVEFDDLAGQSNYGTVQTNNALGQTLGGLKLAAGAANAVQEFDIRVWIETWAEPAINQIVRLEQWYESDQVVLGIAGANAQLLQKHGINEITDELLEQSVNTRINVGLGNGDPQQRMAKFQSATSIVAPLLAQSKDFQTGKKEMDWEAVMQEVYGAAGYRDGGKRFVKDGAPQGQNPMQQPEIDEKVASAQLKKAQARAALLNALSNAAKVGIQMKDIELAEIEQQFRHGHDHMEQLGRAADMGFRHAGEMHNRRMAAQGLGPDGQPVMPPGGGPGGGDGSDGSAGPAAPPPDTPPGLPTPTPPQAAGGEAPPAKKGPRKITIAERDPHTGRATAFHVE